LHSGRFCGRIEPLEALQIFLQSPFPLPFQ
jgi:hypothetical protein